MQFSLGVFPSGIDLEILGAQGAGCARMSAPVTGQDFRQPRLWIPEKAMATHSSTLAWKIPWTEEPGGLQSWGR